MWQGGRKPDGKRGSVRDLCELSSPEDLHFSSSVSWLFDFSAGHHQVWLFAVVVAVVVVDVDVVVLLLGRRAAEGVALAEKRRKCIIPQRVCV